MHDDWGLSCCICMVQCLFLVYSLVVILFLLRPYFSKVSAAISSSGELRFLSEPTLSDTDPEQTDAR